MLYVSSRVLDSYWERCGTNEKLGSEMVRNRSMWEYEHEIPVERSNGTISGMSDVEYPRCATGEVEFLLVFRMVVFYFCECLDCNFLIGGVQSSKSGIGSLRPRYF